MLVSEIVDWILKTLGKDVFKNVVIEGDNCILVDKKDLLRVLFVIKYRCNFEQLVDMTALDMLGNDFRFKLVYIFRNFDDNQVLEVNVKLKEFEKVQSIMEAFSNADWYEREVHEMFGVLFRKRSNLENLLLPKDGKKFPLRKDV